MTEVYCHPGRAPDGPVWTAQDPYIMKWNHSVLSEPDVLTEWAAFGIGLFVGL